MERTSVFEINIDIQACHRIFLDDQKEFYVICQTQQADGKKHLIIRSPMQICNNLQIPLDHTLRSRRVRPGQSEIKSGFKFRYDR